MKATGKEKDSPAQTPPTPPADPMPEGTGTLVGHEAAERFVFFGVQGILAIFLVAHLKSSTGAADHMASGQARAEYHYFLATVFFFPFAGALLAELLWGKSRTILCFSLGYLLGLASLVWSGLDLGLDLVEPRTWVYVGLFLVAVGAGGMQVCVSELLIDQFSEEKQHLLAKAWHWSFFAIYLAAAASFLLVPWLLEKWGPGLAFGVPAVVLVVATFVYWRQRSKYVQAPPPGFQQLKAELLSAESLKQLKTLIPLLLVFLPAFWCVFYQTGSAWVLQAMRMDRKFLGVEWFESQVQAANPILLIALVPLFSLVAYPLVGKLVKLTAERKIAAGMILAVAAFGLSAWIESQLRGGRVVECFSQADRGQWRADHLIDGELENSSWVSDIDPRARSGGHSASLFPQVIIFQLSDSRAWTIDGLRFHPANNLGRYLMQKRDAVDAATARRLAETDVDTCHPRKIEVSVADTPHPARGWRWVGAIYLPRSIEARQTEIRPIDAKFVKLEIVENWGGPFVGLAEVEILAQGEPPADADEALRETWPNVTRMGTRPNIAWQLLGYVLLTLAEVLVATVALELVRARSPQTLKSIFLGMFFLGACVGNLVTAAVNSFLQNEDGTGKLSGPGYYLFFAILLSAMTVLFVVWSKFFTEPAGAEGAEAGES
jgi:POT family proton-dependent oligopeptide transporter